MNMLKLFVNHVYLIHFVIRMNNMFILALVTVNNGCHINLGIYVLNRKAERQVLWMLGQISTYVRTVILFLEV